MTSSGLRLCRSRYAETSSADVRLTTAETRPTEKRSRRFPSVLSVYSVVSSRAESQSMARLLRWHIRHLLKARVAGGLDRCDRKAHRHIIEHPHEHPGRLGQA